MTLITEAETKDIKRTFLALQDAIFVRRSIERTLSMRSLNATIITLLIVLVSPAAFLAQQSANTITVPRLINVSGVFTPADGDRSRARW